jgi:serine/threonine-protein kinase
VVRVVGDSVYTSSGTVKLLKTSFLEDQVAFIIDRMVDDAHLAPTALDSTARMLEAVTLPEPGYELGDILGRGGMGEVFAAHDQRIGREVAVKRLRDERPSAQTISRFLREARVQARLDHPAIVPVHELGTDARGRPYFTMKRLTGSTLAEHHEWDPGESAAARSSMSARLYSSRTRGVVHRISAEHHARRLWRGLRPRLGRRTRARPEATSAQRTERHRLAR